MALFDTNSGLGGLLGDFGDYGFGVPRNTGGLIGDDERDAINKRALLTGGINAALTYLATPKNLNTGSALPYLGKAGLAGFGASQNTVDQALNMAFRNKLLTGRDDNIKSINQDINGVRYEVTYKTDPKTGVRTEIARSMRDAPKEAKEVKLPTSAEEFEIAKGNPAYMKFLREKWDADRKARMTDIATREADYNMPPPKLNTTTNPLIIDNTSVKAPNGITYKFNTIEEANAFRQQTGSK